MIEFNKIKIGGIFHVPFFGIKTIENNKELNQKYSLKLYQTGYKKSLSFVKDSEESCYETITRTGFNLVGNKMCNEELGLFFYGNYVDNSHNVEHIDKEVAREYFEDAKTLNSDKQMRLMRK